MHLKRSKLWIGLLSGAAIVAMIVTLIARIPPAAQQIPSNTAPILIVLSRPANGSTWPADTPVPVTVMVTAGTPIKSVELWADGRLFDTQIPSAKRQSLYNVWSWMPLTEGAHAVFVRAADANGRTADSNAVHIQASPAAGLISVLTAQGGETIQTLAEQNKVTPEQIIAVNPSLDPVGPLAPGMQVFIPGEPFNLPSAGSLSASPPLNGPDSDAKEGYPSGPAFYLEHTLNPNAAAPNAPILSAAAGVCSVTLTIQDNSDSEDGFFVYTLPETALSFQRVTSLKAHAGAGSLQYTIQNQRGHVQFYVSAYNTAGETSSPPVAVNVTGPQCKPAEGKSGDLKYQAGFLTLPTNVQLAYFYASINGGPWQRIPAEHAFLDPSAGPIDLRPQIQSLLGQASAGEVDLDVWGWQGRSLVHLGPLHIRANFASLAICNLSAGCSGDMGSTHWVTEAVVGSDKAEASRKLRWNATGADITYAIWQVSTQPFPAEYSVGAPPGLLISGISDAAVNNETGTASGDFTIDFTNDLNFVNSEQQGSQPARRMAIFGQTSAFDSHLLSELSASWNNPFPSGMFQSMLSQKLYIRVMPIAGGHPASDPSNHVIVTYQPTGDPPPIHIYKVPTYSVEIVPDSYVNEVQVVQKMGILGCSTITGVDHDPYVTWYMNAFKPFATASLAENSYQFWADRIGWKVCPGVVELPEDSTLEQIGAAFVDFWNTLSSTIDQIKGTLVEALASIIPGCDSTCKTLLMTGMNFAITYFTGLPPSLPDFDGAVSMGIDYAVQMAITQSGIPYCDQTCQDAIAGEVKNVASDVAKSGKSQPACSDQSYTLWLYEGTQLYHLKPLCFPPGILYQPLKGSMYERGMVQVRVTRIDGSPQPAPAQQLVVDTRAANAVYGDGHSESDYFQITTQENCTWSQGLQHCTPVTHTNYYNMVFNAPLQGIPYPQKSITVPALKAGQSVVIPVVFESKAYDYKPPNVYSPRAMAVLKAFPDVDLMTVPVDWWRDYTHLTGSGAQITIGAHILCQDQSVGFGGLWNSPCSETSSQQFTAP